MPLQYILGYWDFMAIDLRQIRELLCKSRHRNFSWKLYKFTHVWAWGNNILEVGVGSGALSIVLAKEIKSSTVIGLDISKEALSIAEENRILNEAERMFVLSWVIFFLA